MEPFRILLAALRRLDPERAHRLTIRALRARLGPVVRRPDPPTLAIRLWGLDFSNPIGLAAGFDKNAEVVEPMLRLGFGFVEVGTVTPRPQRGNPRPRLFRLREDGAVINRLGFNNAGLEAAARRLARSRSGIVGVNIGCNRDSADAVADYTLCAQRLAPLADYLVINVSSPNTPGLRALQSRERLAALVAAVRAAATASCHGRPPPLLVKIAPDLAESDRRDIAGLALDGGIDGLVVSNTTVARPSGLKSVYRNEKGGLSGRPLFAPSTALLAEMYLRTEGRIPLVGVGGVASGADAYAKIRAGASLVQLYTALVYEGPGLVRRIKEGLVRRLAEDGFASLSEAVGADHR